MKSLSTNVLLKKDQQRSGEDALEDPQLLEYSSIKLELLLRNVEFVMNNLVCNSIHRLQCLGLCDR